MNRFSTLVIVSIITIVLIAYSHTAYADHSKTQKYLKNDSQKTKFAKKQIIKAKQNNYSTKIQPQVKTAKIQPQKASKIDKTGFKKAPELQGITGCINTDSETLKSAIKNKVVL
ncbi:MAG: hypothetical protein HZC29_04755, partial [Thaumarchaeota archaeon]|nr:hypothetical protein [Nitrososphaerota archaeon]